MAGILDFFGNPANQGLLNLSAGLLQAGGPSPTPVSFGQALGRGLQQGLGGFNAAQQSQQQAKLLDLHGKLYGSQASKLDEDTARQRRLAQIMNGPMGVPSNPMAPGGASMMAPSANPIDGFKSRATTLASEGFLQEANQVADLVKKLNPELEFKDGVWYDKSSGAPVRGGAGINPQGFGYQTSIGPNGQIGVGMLPGAADLFAAQQNIGARATAAHDLVTVPATGPNTPPRFASRLSLLGGAAPAMPSNPMQAPGIAPAAPQQALAAGMTPAQTATQTADAAQQVDIAKNYGKIFNDLQNASMSNPGKIAKFQRIGTLLGDFEGGKLSGTGFDLARLGNSMGIKIDPKLSNKEAAEALTNEVALANRSTAAGEGMPGAMSDMDREFLKNMSPQMAQTAEGRKLIIESRVKVMERENQVAKMARQYKQKHSKVDEDFFSQLSDWSNRNHLFPAK